MIIILGKMISANCVLNCLNPGIKFILRRITKFQRENEKFGAPRYRQNLVWQTISHFNTCCVRSIVALLLPLSTTHINDLWRCPSRCLFLSSFLKLPIISYR